MENTGIEMIQLYERRYQKQICDIHRLVRCIYFIYSKFI